MLVLLSKSGFIDFGFIDHRHRSVRPYAAFPSRLLLLAASFFFGVIGVAEIQAQTLDTLTFGNATSESGHGLTTAFFGEVTPPSLVTAGGGVTPSNPSTTGPSQAVTSGALAQSGRQLLPRTPNADVYGGQMTFTMKVDPVQQNYLTVKFWGSDTNANEWLVLDCNGLEVGPRHDFIGDPNQDNSEGEMFWNFSTAWYPGRWIYRTLPLPLSQTMGQTTVTLTVRSLGVISYYASGAYFGDYQELMKSPTPVLYEAVTHTNSYFDTSAELQGVGPTVLTPLSTPTASSAISSIESGVNSQAKTFINASPTSLAPFDVDYLAEVYGTSWSTYKGSSAIVTQVIAGIDAMVTAYAAAPTTYMGTFGNDSWGGPFGPVGDAIRLLWPEINTGTTMSTTVAYGGSLGTVSRTTAWSTALRASVDYGRFNRRGITNQSIFEAMDIYTANRGLELVQSSNALYESEALRYLNECSGISPWLGNDQPGEGPTPVYGTAPNGPNWYMMTTAGTSKEIGFVGSDYGEVGGEIYRMGIVSGNAAIQARGLVLMQARAYFRYTGTDPNNYLIMLGAEPVGVRNDQEMPGHTVYLGREASDDFLVASQGASVAGSNLLGYFQQAINQGQMWPAVEGWGNSDEYGAENQMPLLPDYWTAASTQAQTGALLPETNNAGLPNFAWADPQNMTVAVKYGSGATEENFYADMLWHEPYYINGMAKVFDLTPTQARDVEVMLQDEQFTSSGVTLMGSDVTDGTYEPWDNPTMVSAGQPFTEAIRSDLTTIPSTNLDGGRGNGYTLRWGHWLVGMNGYQLSTGTAYAMKMPSDFTSGTDLISGKTFTGQITLQPQTAVVFYMTNSIDPAPAPNRVLYLGATGSNSEVILNWNAAGGANYYTVLRSTTSGGPYSVVANGLTQVQYVDNTVTNGSKYYYVVATYNAAGLTGGNSPQATATPMASESAGLPPPWANADIGTVGATGSATYSSGTFTVNGSGADIWSNADQFQFVYAPLIANGSITVKVVSLQNTNANAKTGIMIRQSLNSEDLNVDLILTPANGVQLNRRYALDGGSSTVASQTGIAAPYWLQLAYTDQNTFTGYISPDGVTWTELGTTGLGNWVAGGNFIGMVDTSHNNGTLSTAVFSNVTLTGVPTDTTAAVPLLSATIVGEQVNLKWGAITGATGYNLKRSSTSGGPYTAIAANTGSVSYVDSSVTAGSTYYYVVSSLNATGESANSNQVSAILPGFSLSPGSSSMSITAGSSASVPFTILATGGFTQPITFSCSVPGVSVTCTFASPVLTPAGASTATSVSVAWPAGVAQVERPSNGRHGRIVILSAIGFLLIGFRFRKKDRLFKSGLGKLTLLLLALLPAAAFISGCGGSNNAPGGAPAAPLTHTLTITGTAGQLIQTTTVNLIVTVN